MTKKAEKEDKADTPKKIKKRWGDRKEATRVRNVDTFMKMVPYLMRSRDASCVYLKEVIDATNLVKFIEENDKKYSYFGVVLSAITRTLALRPHMNRFVQGLRHYQRRKIVLSFVAKKKFTEEAIETNVKIAFDRYATLDDVTERLSGSIKVAKDESKDDTDELLTKLMKMPRFMLRMVMSFMDWLDFHGWYPKFMNDVDPMMSSAFITNLGSIGLETVPFHHLYDRGTCSLFVALGKVHKGMINVEGEGLVERDVIEIAITLDERISNGFYYIKAIELMKDLLKHPEKLLEKPEEVPDDL